METLKRIDVAVKDPRGEIMNIFEGPIEHIALITSKKGSIRANHYHKEDQQYIYLVSGAYESHCCDVGNPEKKASAQRQTRRHRLHSPSDGSLPKIYGRLRLFSP